MDYSKAEAGEITLGLLLDVLEYNSSVPGGYPNSRTLIDDVGDLRIALMTKGRVTATGSARTWI